MPIHLDSHPPDVELTPGTTKSDIVEFLYRHSAYGYRPMEISDELDIPDGTATTTLSRLYADGVVGKTAEGYYHALDDREDIRRYVASLRQLHRSFGHHRAEDDPSSDTVPSVSEDTLAAELESVEGELDG